MSNIARKYIKNEWKLRLGGCREHLFDHWDAVGGSYGCLWSIFMDLGVILDSILRAISVRKCVIFQTIFWLVVGWSIFRSILVCFGAKMWSTMKHVRLWKTFVLLNEFNDFQGLGSIFWAKICGKTHLKSELGSEAVFCWFFDILRSFWGPFCQQKSIQNLYEFWMKLGSYLRRQMELHFRLTLE